MDENPTAGNQDDDRITPDDHNTRGNSSKDVLTLIPHIIEKLSQEIPDIIDRHLTQRGVISVAGSNEEFQNDGDANTQSKNRDAGAQSHNRDTGAQLTEGNAGFQENKMDKRANDKSVQSLKNSFDNVSNLIGIGGKRKIDARESTPPIIMSEEILTSIGDELGLDEVTGVNINARLAKQIEHSYLEASSESTALSKIMTNYSLPGNLEKLAVPKLNKEIELTTTGYQNNDHFVCSKEKSLYSSQNYLAKSIAIISKIADDVLADTDKGSTLNHKAGFTFM